MAIKSHDLAIHVPAKALNSEAIVDGGELSPLTVEEQATILKALQKSSREYQLMFYLAFYRCTFANDLYFTNQVFTQS
jgi:hypothetical protein